MKVDEEWGFFVNLEDPIPSFKLNSSDIPESFSQMEIGEESESLCSLDTRRRATSYCIENRGIALQSVPDDSYRILSIGFIFMLGLFTIRMIYIF